MISVLYVDDEPDLLRIGKLFLEQTGEFLVETAVSATDALALMERKQYDAVVSDYLMPGMNGIGFLKEIRASGNTVPFIVFTGRGREEVVIEAIDEGADSYLQKGGSPQHLFAELAHKIRISVSRRQAEEALRVSEERYLTLFSRSLDCFYIHDLDGRFIDANPSALSLTGFSREELPHLNISDLLDPEAAAWAHRTFETIIRDGVHGKTIELEVRRKDGSKIWIETKAALIRRDGRPYAILGVARDITGRKAAEEATAVAAREWEATFNATSDGICLIGADQKIIRCNRRMGEIVRGIPLPELAGKPCHEILHHAAGPIPGCPFIAAKTTLLPQSTELQVGERWFEVTADPILDRSGAFTGAVHIMRDVTTRKAAEETLSQANRKLKLLSGITRHDISNRISVLMGYLDLAKLEYSDPVLLKYLDKMESAVTGIRLQIEFARVYQELGIHEPQWHDLEALLARIAVPHEITLAVDPGVKGISVYADRMLEQVFENLLDNSIRHGRRVTGITVSARESGDGLVIAWEDNGAGVPAHEKEKIFERGYGKNTGIGLFLAREILMLTRMTIRETGQEGAGARFEITVPSRGYRIAGGQGC